MNLTDADLDAILKRLTLANTRRIWPDLVVREEVRPDGAQDLPLYDVYPQPPDLVPASGVLADPSRATAATGEMLFDDAIDRLAAAIGQAFAQKGGEQIAGAN